MSSTSRNILVYFLPIAAIIAVFIFVNPAVGSLLMLAYIPILIFTERANLFAALGSINYRKGNIEKAIYWLDKAYASGRALPAVLMTYAYILLRQGQLSRAEDILKGIPDKKLKPSDALYLKSNLALVLWKKGELDGAISLYEDLYEQYKTTMVYGSMGHLLNLKGDLDRALAFNREAYEYNKDNSIIADNLGKTYYLRGEFDKAREIYKELMPRNPSHPGVYYNNGLVLLKHNEPEKALFSFERALDFQISFLSTVTREEIEAEIAKLKPESGTEKQSIQ